MTAGRTSSQVLSMQVMSFCKGQEELASGVNSLDLPAWRLTNLLQLHDAVLNLHAACCVLQPQLKQMDRQLPSVPAETCSLMKLAECLLGDCSSTSGKMFKLNMQIRRMVGHRDSCTSLVHRRCLAVSCELRTWCCSHQLPSMTMTLANGMIPVCSSSEDAY